MTDLAVRERAGTAAEWQPTGPIGRLARLVLATALGVGLVSILDQGGVVGFRKPSVPTEVIVWVLTAAMVALFVILAGAVARGVGRPSPWRWRLGAAVLLATAALGAALIGHTTYGGVWGFPLADLVWAFDVAMLLQTIVAALIAFAIRLPGCEVGVWPALIARARGKSSRPVAGLACIVGLDLIDRWEARMRQADTGLPSGR